MTTTSRAIIIAIVLFSLSAAAAAAPVNDNWESATLIPPGTTSLPGTVVGATVQLCEPVNHTFPDEGQVATKKTVWYKWQAPSNGSFTFWANSGSSFLDTTLSAYRLQPGLCGSVLTQIPYPIIENHNYNYDLGWTGGGSRVAFRALAGEIIYLAVDAYTPVEGTFSIGWEKTRFRYDVSLDYKNSGTDLVITRITPSAIDWWIARYGNHSAFATLAGMTFGAQSDQTFMADYDGDHVADLVAVRKEQGALRWYISTRTGKMIRSLQWGLSTDKVVIGDYDGDGIADVTVTRNDLTANLKTWHILRSKDNQHMAIQFGNATDEETVGDYDGGGKTDVVALRPENGVYRWFILCSSSNEVMSRDFGYSTGGDIPVVVNFDADFKTDIAVFRATNPTTTEYNGYWFSVDSSSELPLDQRPVRYQKFGQSNDRPQPGDFDGDLKTDLAIVRGGVWWIQRSIGNSVEAHQWGYGSDRPLTDGGNFVSRIFY